MEEKNELNDIILNKSSSSSSNKKVVLAVATLGVILIIVVMLMNTLNSNSGENLPKPVPLPTPQAVESQMANVQNEEEPLFEEIEVEQEEVDDKNNLEQIAQKLKKESIAEKKITSTTKTETKTKAVEPKKIVTKTDEPAKTDTSGSYYIQVGSFSKYKPNDSFLKSITSKGYKYKYHKVGNLNKVLVGPFVNEKKARSELRIIRSDIEAGAFLTKI